MCVKYHIWLKLYSPAERKLDFSSCVYSPRNIYMLLKSKALDESHMQYNLLLHRIFQRSEENFVCEGRTLGDGLPVLVV